MARLGRPPLTTDGTFTLVPDVLFLSIGAILCIFMKSSHSPSHLMAGLIGHRQPERQWTHTMVHTGALSTAHRPILVYNFVVVTVYCCVPP